MKYEIYNYCLAEMTNMTKKYYLTILINICREIQKRPICKNGNKVKISEIKNIDPKKQSDHVIKSIKSKSGILF